MSALRAARVLVAALDSPDPRVALQAAIAILDLAGVGRRFTRCEHVAAPAMLAEVHRLEARRSPATLQVAA